MGLEKGIEVGGTNGGGGGEEGENSPYVRKHRSLTPLGPLPCFPFNFKHNLLRQGMGTADQLALLQLLYVSNTYF